MEIQSTKKIKQRGTLLRWGTFTTLVAVVFLWSVATANAATMTLSPSTGNYSVGKSFSVSVYLSSADQPVNAVSGVLSFSSSVLEVTGVTKTGSVINLWVQDPSYSNAAGTVTFEGIALNPGYTGTGGRVITVNFKVKGTGSTTISFSSASVLANDGKGTNVLSGVGSARFDINDAQTGTTPTPPGETPAPTPEPTTKPGAPRISSSTHPEEDKWYNNNDPIFLWKLPVGITGVNFLADHEVETDPGTSSDGVMSSHGYTGVEDGTWYMHLRFKNSFGWGPVSHYKFQIDTHKPENFTIQEIARQDLTEPVASFTFQASDVTSGIDHYDVQIDGGAVETWHDDGGHTYHTAALNPGSHTLVAKAVDKAGNGIANSADFLIKSIDSPVFTDYPTEVGAGEVLKLKGTTYPNMTVAIFLQREQDDPKQYTVVANDRGDFEFIAPDRLREGVYTVWAEAINAKLAHSSPSNKLTIYAQASAVQHVASQLVVVLSVVVPLIGLFLSLLLMLWYFWSKYRHLSKKLTAEVREAEEGLHESFTTLREHVHEQVKMLEHAGSKRELTREEARIIKQLRSDLDVAEKTIHKEMEDIKKAVK